MSNGKVHLKNVVARQLPEYIRENYPTFVAFVEAYYDYLAQNSVDLSKTRDIDTTLESFLQYFKKEMAHNLPANLPNERFLLQHIKDQYLAKGSESSYRLLFRLLYGKEIYMEYPGKSMLRVSDGRWKQDVSLIVRIDAGDPEFIVGKIVDVQTSKKIYRTAIDRQTLKLTKVTANVESYAIVDEVNRLYEIFLDRNFYGEINPGDVIKLGSDFQALVLPVTSVLKIQNGGQGFKPGMVFQVSSGNGTAIWFKVTSVEDDEANDIKGKLKTIDLIKFGLGYDTDFSITVLPTSAVRASKKIEQQLSTITYSKVLGNVGKINVLTSGSGYTHTPTVVIGGNGSGAAAHAVMGTGAQAGQVVDIVIDSLGEGYTTGFANIVNDPLDTVGFGATVEVILGDYYAYLTGDSMKGFNELGYINYSDYWDQAESGSGAVATSVISDGLIRSISVTDSGSGYTMVPEVTIDGDGTGASAFAVLGTGALAGKVVQVVMDTFGEGYTEGGTTITITAHEDDVTGAGAEAEATIVDGGVSELTLSSRGSGYIYKKPVVDINIPQNTSGVPIVNSAPAEAIVIIGDQWESETEVELRQYIWHDNNMYRVVVAGLTGSTAPTHTTGEATNGDATLAHITTRTANAVNFLKLTDCGYGYTSQPNVKIIGPSGWADGAYVGSIARQFYLDAKDTTGTNPALINVTLGALSKYPGYYKTNDGFISDAMFVQDSYYYQAFSYVIKIDEQLASYASAVRSMLHPSGMALFGEYSINNQIDLSVALEILIKSLGVTFYDEFIVEDATYVHLYKDVSDVVESASGSSLIDSITAKYFGKLVSSETNPQTDFAVKTFGKRATDSITETDEITAKSFGKLANDSPVITEAMTRVMGRSISESYSGVSESASKLTTKPLTDSQSLADELTKRDFTKVVTGVNTAVILEEVTRDFSKSLADSYVSSAVTETLTRVFSKSASDTPLATDTPAKETTKYVIDTSIGTFTQSGYIVFNPYEEGGYFLELYANAYASTF